MEGNDIYKIAERLFPICRSITGNGVRETLRILQEYCSELEIHEVPSGTEVFDWTVPKEWNIREAYIENEQEERVVDFHNNNLHVMGYSIPVDQYMDKEELLQHIYVENSQPDAIPYVTSYYTERFGFCMSKNERDKLADGTYHVVIDSSLEDGSLTYGEILIPGERKEEIFLSTYICHPSMANNECSGPALAIYLANWIKAMKHRKYSYRIIFIPETIGSITYLSLHKDELKEKVIAGFVLSCVGDDRTYSIVESRYGNTLADKVLTNVLKYHYPEYNRFSFLVRGSDERQYNAPGIDLPVCSVCRTKYGRYPEYHTSLDNMDLISPEGFQGSFEVMSQCITALEYNEKYKVTCFCEPQLGKRGLYPTVSHKGQYNEVRKLTNLIAYADGQNDLIDISNRIGVPIKAMIENVDTLLENGLFVKV